MTKHRKYGIIETNRSIIIISTSTFRNKYTPKGEHTAHDDRYQNRKNPAAYPDTAHRPAFNNPYPDLHRPVRSNPRNLYGIHLDRPSPVRNDAGACPDVTDPDNIRQHRIRILHRITAPKTRHPKTN